MPAPQSLETRCDRCKIATSCPAKGASPLQLGKKVLLCRLVGGYAVKPIEAGVLSPESAERMAADGPCMTLAEVPRKDPDSGHVYREVVKVFHQPILHPRQKTSHRADIMLHSSHVRQQRGSGGVR